MHSPRSRRRSRTAPRPLDRPLPVIAEGGFLSSSLSSSRAMMMLTMSSIATECQTAATVVMNNNTGGDDSVAARRQKQRPSAHFPSFGATKYTRPRVRACVRRAYLSDARHHGVGNGPEKKTTIKTPTGAAYGRADGMPAAS